MARIHKVLYRKDLNDADNHDSVITHLGPAILDCEAKWALGSIIMKKASGGDSPDTESASTFILNFPAGYSAWNSLVRLHLSDFISLLDFILVASCFWLTR